MDARSRVIDAGEGFRTRMLALALEAARGHEPAHLIRAVLDSLLETTCFERGMLGQYVFDVEHGCAFQVLALQGTAWNAVTRAFFDVDALEGEGLASSSSVAGALLRGDGEARRPSQNLRGEVEASRAVFGFALTDGDRLVGVLALEGRVPEGVEVAGELRPAVELASTLMARMSRSGGASPLDLQREVEFARVVLDSIADAVLTLDAVGNVLSANRAAERIFGYAVGELIGLHVATLFVGASTSFDPTSMATGQVRVLGVDRDTEGRRKDGTAFPVRVGMCKERFLEGRVVTWIVHDLSQVRTLQQDLERFFKISLDMVAIVSFEGTIRGANPAWERQIGYAVEGLQGRSLMGLIAPEWRVGFEQRLERLVADERHAEQFETPCLDAQGRVRWLQWSVVPARAERLLYVAANDITEARQASEQSALLASIVASSTDSIIGTSSEGTIIAWNQAAVKLYGYGAEEVVGRSISILQGTGPLDTLPSMIARVLDGASLTNVEVVHRRKSGSSVVVSLAISPLSRADGGILGSSIIVRDLTVVKEVDRLRASLRDKYHYDNVVGVSRAMQQVFHVVERVTSANAPVLLTGESGVGKEVLAKLLHFQGNRRDRPFVAVNCAAIPEELLESELFGHEKGAFTGAVQRRIGRFEEASDGTILLDEIGELDARMQAKLLRVLQERCFERVGSNRTIVVEARVIATTNRALEEEIKVGRFREDLFYRLNVIRIHVPPLRERSEDIPALVQLMLARLQASEGRKIHRVTPHAMERLCAYPWPGNIRELENTIFRAGLVCLGSEIDVDALPAHVCGAVVSAERRDEAALEGTVVLPATMTLAEQEEYMIRRVYKEVDGDIAEAIRRLGLSRATLYRKLSKFGLVSGGE